MDIPESASPHRDSLNTEVLDELYDSDKRFRDRWAATHQHYKLGQQEVSAYLNIFYMFKTVILLVKRVNIWPTISCATITFIQTTCHV